VIFGKPDGSIWVMLFLEKTCRWTRRRFQPLWTGQDQILEGFLGVFLGLTRCYRCFIHNYGRIARLLT